jgi:hypothetical protein
MRATALTEVNYMIERMSVWKMKIGVAHQVMSKPFGGYVFVHMTGISQSANVIYRNGVFYR